MLMKLLLKRVLPTVVGLAILAVAGMWLYGFLGVKMGFVGPTQVPGLNAISHHGAEAAGGVAGAAKTKLGL